MTEQQTMRLYSAYHDLEKIGIDDDLIIFEGIEKVPFFGYPFMLDRIVISICKSGWAKGQYDMKDIAICQNDIMVLLPDHLITFGDVSPDFAATVIMMTKSFAQNLRQRKSLNAQLHFNRKATIPLTDNEFSTTAHCFEVLKFIVGSELEDRLQMISEVFDVMFRMFVGFDKFKSQTESGKSRQEQVFERFYDLVITHHRQSREVIWYADKLCMTPKYLASIVKQVTGKSANEWINQYVILEAKAMMKTQRSLTIQEVADRLGFVDQATFSKFFKKQTGQNPSAYRDT